jgi:hypothetical protein
MEFNTSQAIKAGVIGGVLLALLNLMSLVINVLVSWVDIAALLGLLGCCIWLLGLVVAAGTGALAVKYTASNIQKLNDALKVSAIAGLAAGVISAVVQLIIAFVQPLISGTTYDYTSTLPEGLGSGLGLGFMGAAGYACCCAPLTIIFTIILAAIGGAIYAMVQLKIK